MALALLRGRSHLSNSADGQTDIAYPSICYQPRAGTMPGSPRQFSEPGRIEDLGRARTRRPCWGVNPAGRAGLEPGGRAGLEPGGAVLGSNRAGRAELETRRAVLSSNPAGRAELEPGGPCWARTRRAVLGSEPGGPCWARNPAGRLGSNPAGRAGSNPAGRAGARTRRPCWARTRPDRTWQNKNRRFRSSGPVAEHRSRPAPTGGSSVPATLTLELQLHPVRTQLVLSVGLIVLLAGEHPLLLDERIVEWMIGCVVESFGVGRLCCDQSVGHLGCVRCRLPP